jgi:hypothetical protein
VFRLYTIVVPSQPMMEWWGGVEGRSMVVFSLIRCTYQSIIRCLAVMPWVGLG